MAQVETVKLVQYNVIRIYIYIYNICRLFILYAVSGFRSTKLSCVQNRLFWLHQSELRFSAYGVT